MIDFRDGDIIHAKTRLLKWLMLCDLSMVEHLAARHRFIKKSWLCQSSWCKLHHLCDDLPDILHNFNRDDGDVDDDERCY
jgi:hypothetical protein